MKKIFCIFAAAAFALGTLTMVSCNKEDEEVTPKTSDSTNTNNGSASATDLIGTWTMVSEDFTTTYVFTATTMTRTTDWEKLECAYTYANGVLTLTDAKYYEIQQDDSWALMEQPDSNVSSTVNVNLLQNNAVLVMRQQIPEEEYSPAHEEVYCLYREGKTITVNAADLQGEWQWYMLGDTSNIRALISFDGNNYDLIITAWCERYKGTYTIDNGYLVLSATKFYRCEWEGRNESNPRDAQWVETGLEDTTPEWVSHRMPFFVNGNEAYAILANLPALYVKK